MNPNQLSSEKDEDDHNNLSSYSPSFSTYTANTHIADIASRVAATDFFNDDFEFGSAETAGSMPVYPVFNRDLLRDLGSDQNPVQLRKLFFQEDSVNNNNNNNYNDDEEEELDGVSPESYCLWVPKSPSPSPSQSPSRVMKSSSTGSGPGPDPVMPKAWRLRNLLRRCKSDGKEGLMLVSGADLTKKSGKGKPSRTTSSSSRGGSKEVGATRRKSYLPYKPDLLGFFGSPQTLRSINIPPF